MFEPSHEIEFDLEDPASLRKAEAHLEYLLRIVRFALENPPLHAAKADALPANKNVPSVPLDHGAGEEAIIREAIDSFPMRFTSSDLYKLQASSGKLVSRASVKNVLAELVSKDLLRVVEVGKGRKPTTYERNII